MDELAAGVVAGDARSLARAATLVENRTARGRQIIRDIFPQTGRASMVGITGPPGAGKSTLADALTKHLRHKGERVAVLAVDPSSAFTKGAILGDRIRMQPHFGDPGVFIRSMATRGSLGGLAPATAEVALLLDGAGYGTVLVETVGVGQDEIAVATLAHVTVVVLVPGAGDDVQTIKAGIMEIADVFAVNKADLPGAEQLQQQLRAAQSLASARAKADAAPVCLVSAAEHRGIPELWGAIQKAAHSARDSTELWRVRLQELLREDLLEGLSAQDMDAAAVRVATRQEDPYSAAAQLKKELIRNAGRD